MDALAPLKIVTHDNFCLEKKPDPCGLVIFGASGDLAKRKLIPALFELHANKLLAPEFFILGFARTAWNDESFRKYCEEILQSQPLAPLRQAQGKLTFSREGRGNQAENIKSFLKMIYYENGDYADCATLQKLKARLLALGDTHKTRGNVIFQLATPPEVYRDLLFCLHRNGLIYSHRGSAGWNRVVIEKPFGNDFDSARTLAHELASILSEEQIYRIDHYLGKETVQNILIFRFANSIFEPIWSHHHIDHVQITVAETLGVENRASYFEKAGVLRDMFQNHMLQLLTLAAMEPPERFDARDYRDEKVKLTRAIRPLPLDELDRFVVRGQYGSGKIAGMSVPAYREEKGVSPQSAVETYAAMKLFIDNPRWQGVPFYLRSGKRLSNAASEIAIQFKGVPRSIFEGLPPEAFNPNVLSFRIQPEEGISLNFEAKHPGPKTCMATLNLKFNYKETFQSVPMNAYVRLLLDVMQGDETLFIRQDMIDNAWELITPVLKAWGKSPSASFPNYGAGSAGPREADALIEKDGRKWRDL